MHSNLIVRMTKKTTRLHFQYLIEIENIFKILVLCNSHTKSYVIKFVIDNFNPIFRLEDAVDTSKVEEKFA